MKTILNANKGYYLVRINSNLSPIQNVKVRNMNLLTKRPKQGNESTFGTPRATSILINEPTLKYIIVFKREYNQNKNNLQPNGMNDILKTITTAGIFTIAVVYFPGTLSLVILGGITYFGFKAYKFFKQGNQLMQAFIDTIPNSKGRTKTRSQKEKDEFRATALQTFPMAFWGLFQNFFPLIGSQAQQARIATEKLHKMSIQTILAHVKQGTTPGRQLESELFGFDIQNEMNFNPPISTGYSASTGSSPYVTIEFMATCGNHRMMIYAEGKIIQPRLTQDSVEIETDVELTRLKVTWIDTWKEIIFNPIDVSLKTKYPSNVKVGEYREIPPNH